MKKTIFIKNAAILTATSLILRFAGIVFKVWLASKIGAEGIGLYQLVFSVYMFVATFATSGICTAVTRLVSQELAIGQKETIRRIITRCVQLSLIIATITIGILFFGAEFISNKLLHQPSAALSLKILGFSLPFMGICSCIKGYFIARRKAAPTSFSQLLEQAVRIAVIIPLVLKYNNLGLEIACAAVLIGDTLAEATSCLYVVIRYKFDIKKLVISTTNTQKPYKLLTAISHIALPITSGRYLNALLRMIENVLVPVCLSNLNQNGISLFGMIKGMALPLLFFPSSLLGALSTMLLPEIAEATTCGKQGILRSVVYRIIKITSLISIIFAAIFLTCGSNLGMLLYKTKDVGFLMCALSPIVPFMYLDAISDGILKGLDQQKFTFFTSVGDSCIRILLILLLVKRFGIYGFIGIMYFSNFLTCALNVTRLSRVAGTKLNLSKNFFIPVCCAYTVCIFAKLILNLLKTPALPYILFICIVCMPIYLLLLLLFGIVDGDDVSFLTRK